jgi:hypothetical protein
MAPLDGSATAAKVEFVLETDQAPEFWQFLNGLRDDDLLVELIVTIWMPDRHKRRCALRPTD